MAEVAIALGILSAGLTLILGTLPYALDSMKVSNNRAMERRIAQNITGELMLNEWDILHEFDSTTGAAPVRYYDEQGIELPGPNPGDRHVYTAQVRIHPRDLAIPDETSSLPAMTPLYSFPDEIGGQLGPAVSANLRRAVIDITDIPIPNFAFNPVSDKGKFRTYGALLGNMTDNDTPINRASSGW